MSFAGGGDGPPPIFESMTLAKPEEAPENENAESFSAHPDGTHSDEREDEGSAVTDARDDVQSDQSDQLDLFNFKPEKTTGCEHIDQAIAQAIEHTRASTQKALDLRTGTDAYDGNVAETAVDDWQILEVARLAEEQAIDDREVVRRLRYGAHFYRSFRVHAEAPPQPVDDAQFTYSPAVSLVQAVKNTRISILDLFESHFGIRTSQDAEDLQAAEDLQDAQDAQPEPEPEDIKHDPKQHRQTLQMMNLRENAEEFTPGFSAFVSINGNAISSPDASEARYFQDIDNGSLNMSFNLRLPDRDYSTLHISCYAHGLGIDQERIGHLTIFVRDLISVSSETHPEPAKSLEQFCSGVQPASDPVVISLQATTAQLSLPQGIMAKLIKISLKGTRATAQLRAIQDELRQEFIEIKLLVPGDKLAFATKLTEVINNVKKAELETDPLECFFKHAPDHKTFFLGHAPKPGSPDFPRPQDLQLVHFANAEQHLIHNVASIAWEQFIQEKSAEKLSHITFLAAIVPLAEDGLDWLVVKVDAQADLFPQSGDPCTVTIDNAHFESPPPPVDVDASFNQFFQDLLSSFTARGPLDTLNKTCSQLAYLWSEDEYKQFCRTEDELDVAEGNETFMMRVRSLYDEKSDLFKPITPAPSDNEESDDDKSEHFFRGEVVNCTDQDIPWGYRTVVIRHPKRFKVTLPTVSLEESETLTGYLSRVGDEGLEKIHLKTVASDKTAKAQSYAINSLKHPPSGLPIPPTEQSQQAYKYMLKFDQRAASRFNLLEELPGVGNVVTNKAGPAFIQEIFDKLPAAMKRCLTDMSESYERLHFIAGVAGSGKSYLMEVLILFAMFGNGVEDPPKQKVLYILNNNVQVETFCKRLGQTFRDWGFTDADGSKPAPNIMRLYPLAGELRTTKNSFKPPQETEIEHLALQLRCIQSLEAVCTNVLECKSAAKLARNANRDKALHQFAVEQMTKDPKRYTFMNDSIDHVRKGEPMDSEETSYFNEGVRALYRDSVTDFSGIIVTTPVGATPLIIREHLNPDLVIVDEAGTMDESSLLIPIGHYSPKAWVITGDIAQKPPHLTMEHDLGPGKVSSNPFLLQKQTATMKRAVEGSSLHSKLDMNMRAHGNVAEPVNRLFYNDAMKLVHGWKEDKALDAIISWYIQNVNSDHPIDKCFAQLEFTHARVTQRSFSKVNITHAKWIMEQVMSLLNSGLTGVGKNSGKPITVLVVATYKQQVVELTRMFMNKTRELGLDAAAVERIKIKTIDNAQGDEAELVIYDMVTTSTPAFVAEEFRNTLGLSRSAAFLIVIANRGNFIGHEKNEIMQRRSLELSRIYDFIAESPVNKRIESCKKCETHEHATADCQGPDVDMSGKKCERRSCGEDGHTAAFCPKRFCGNCAKRGHTSGECPLDYFICSACGRKGHHYFNCTTPAGSQSCTTCGKTGHTHFRCPDSRVQICRNCEQEGHISKDCPEPPLESSIKCRSCGQEGHKAKDCPEPQEGGSSFNCHNCGQEGHKAKDCPEPQEGGSSFNCHNCGQEGHKAKDCPEPERAGMPHRPCPNCHEVGHWKDSCPKRTCKYCGEEGHIAPQCTTPRCNRCFELGHLAPTCDKPPSKCTKCGGAHLERLCQGKDPKQRNKRREDFAAKTMSDIEHESLRREYADRGQTSDDIQALRMALNGDESGSGGAPADDQNLGQDWGAPADDQNLGQDWGAPADDQNLRQDWGAPADDQEVESQW